MNRIADGLVPISLFALCAGYPQVALAGVIVCGVIAGCAYVGGDDE